MAIKFDTVNTQYSVDELLPVARQANIDHLASEIKRMIADEPLTIKCEESITGPDLRSGMKQLSMFYAIVGASETEHNFWEDKTP